MSINPGQESARISNWLRDRWDPILKMPYFALICTEVDNYKNATNQAERDIAYNAAVKLIVDKRYTDSQAKTCLNQAFPTIMPRGPGIRW